MEKKAYNVLTKQEINISKLDEQIAFLKEARIRAIYSNEKKSEVEAFIVDNPKDIWINYADGFGFQLIDAAPISVFVKDAHSRYTYLNAKAREMMDFNNRIVIGKVDKDVLKDKKNLQTFLKEDQLVLSSKRKRSITEAWEPQTGDYVVHKTTRYPIFTVNNKKDVIGIVSVAEDITWSQKALVGKRILKMITHDWITDIIKAMYYNHSSDPNITKFSELSSFVAEYLDNLTFFYAGDFDRKSFYTGLKYINIIKDVIRPMQKFIDIFSQGDPYFQVPELIYSKDKFLLTCHPVLLKIMVYQQIRNHISHGQRKTKLKIEIEKNGKNNGVNFIFISPGKKISSEIIARFGNPMPIYPKNEYSKERIGLGIYICKKISSIHNGDSPEYYYSKKYAANCFSYEIRNLNHK